MTSPLLPRGELFCGGDWTPARSGATFATVDPATEEPITTVARGAAADIGDAVAAARAAFTGPVRRIASGERARLLSQVARRIEAHTGELAELETRDTGKPLSLARGEITGCVRYFDYYAGAADKIHGQTIPLGPDYLDYTAREPVGVTAHITPWNAPLSMVCRSLAPALAAGNTAVVKPAEQTPLTALALATIFSTTDWPPGTYNVVTGLGADAGAALAGHPGIDALNFTGSVRTGQAVLRAASTPITPVVLELGGKSPQIVFDDADLDLAAAEIAKGIYTNTGQYCDAGSRVLVHTAVHRQLLDRLLALTAKLKLGNGIDDPDLGPLISAAQRDRVLGYLASARADGARVHTPAPVDFPRGYFVAPTIVDGVTGRMRVAREEIFGPVLTVTPFHDDREAAAIADATDYGLAAGIFTRSIDRALGMARDLDTGYVMINEYFTGGPETPFGGRKMSGFGRERGLAALAHFTRLKSVVIRIR